MAQVVHSPADSEARSEAQPTVALDGSLFSARRVRHFLDSLATRNLVLRAQWTLRALVTQNSGQLGPARRLATMRVYRPRVVALLQELHPHYAGCAVPLSASAALRHRLAADLVLEMAVGYRRVVDDVLDGGGGGRTTLAAGVGGAMHFYAESLIDAWEVLLPQPSGLWQELHGLYALAEERGLLGEPAREGSGSDAVATPLDDYRRVLLLGACDPYALYPGQCRRIYHWVTDWQRAARISKRLSFDMPNGRFLVSLRSDTGAVPLTKVSEIRAPQSVRSLDAIEVARRVHQRLRSMHGGRPLPEGTLPEALAADPDAVLLQRIGRDWGGADAARRWHRLRSSTVVEMYVGRGAVHGALAPDRADDSDHVPPKSPSKPPPMLVEPARAAGAASAGPHVLAVVNESVGGLCVMAPQEAGVRLRVGDPVVWRSRGGGRWSAGAVRWLRSPDDGRVEFGIELFAVGVRLVNAVPATVEGMPIQSACTAIMLPENPAQPFPGDTLLWSQPREPHCERLWVTDPAADHGHWYGFRLLECAPAFERLQLVPVARDDAAEAAAAADAVAAMMTLPERHPRR